MFFWIIIAFMLLVGPLLWMGYIWGMYASREKLMVMQRHKCDLPDGAPLVSIIIPARNEQDGIEACVRAAAEQDYPSYEVIAINDRSDDRTGEILDGISAEHDHVRVIHNSDAPQPGWTGKCSVLHRHTPSAKGEWLLFLDADVTLESHAVRDTVAVAMTKNYGLLSLLPQLDARGFWESLMLPLVTGAVMGAYAIALANADRRKAGFANGQFILIRRDVYQAIGTHEAVKDKLSEDVAIGRLAKQGKHRPRISIGTEHANVRMYSSLSDIVRGYARNFYGVGLGSPWRILGLMGFTLIMLAAYVALPFTIAAAVLGNPWYLVINAVHIAMMTYALGQQMRWSGVSRLIALALPVGLVVLFYTLWRGLLLCIRQKVEWRGDSYSASPAN